MGTRNKKENPGFIKGLMAYYLLAYYKHYHREEQRNHFFAIMAASGQSGSGQSSVPGGSNSGAAGAGGQGSRGGDDDITSGKNDRDRKLGSDGNFVGKSTGNQVDEAGVSAATGGTTIGLNSEVDEVKVGGVTTGRKGTSGPEGGIDEEEMRRLSGEGRVVTEGTASATPEEQMRIARERNPEMEERRSSVDAGTGAGSALNKVNPQDVDDATGSSQRPFPRDTDDNDKGAERKTLGNP